MLSNGTIPAVAGGLRTRTFDSAENARRKVVKYVFWVYWILIFEGALRKWAFPQFHEVIFFLRDPIVLLIYFIAWRHHLIKRSGLLTAGVVIAFLFVPLMLVQHLVIDMNVFTLLYGWRMYFFYLPLIFVIKDTFQHDDINRLIRHTLYVSIPLSVLVYFQYISPPSSFVNAAYSDGHVFIVANNIVRTTGTFTFTAGQTMFCASLIAMLIFVWLYRKRFPTFSMPWLLAASGSAITTLLLSGSRTAFFMAALVVMATFFGLFFTRGVQRKLTGVAILVLLLGVATLLFLGPFRNSFDALDTRFKQADAQEGSAIRRAFYPVFAFTDRLVTTQVIGHGLGYGTSGGSKLATGKIRIVLPEDELSRVVMEVGPAFGLLYIGYRIFFSLILFGRCIRSAREDNLLPMILLGFIGFYMLAGNVTQTGTVHGYNWIFIGLTMAAMRAPSEIERSQKVGLSPGIASVGRSK
ncbi:MAG TPA: hypothetical protein VJS66_00010 [Burkholderiales bacterium]|nr:hypothetical protein [Burkholderiales bacterium]